MTKILHITPHFGGGVGTVLRALIDGIAGESNHTQEVVSFEYLNSKTEQWCKSNGIKIHSEVSPDSDWLLTKVSDADIVHIHFWNHPALYFFFYNFSGRSARIVMWSHVNGHFAPYLFNDAVIDFPEIFVLSTNYSLSQKKLLNRSDVWKRNHLRTVHSTAGLNGFDKIEAKEHCGINVGYVGTVDYAKMHPDFIDICSTVNSTNVHFIVCGGNCHKEILLEAKEKGVADKFNFYGQVDNVKDVLSQIDIFAYPLNRKNYGTGEQVLIEAMSAGIPQVVFADGPEEYVVADGETGIVCNTKKRFSEAIDFLCKNELVRAEMSINSLKRSKIQFNLNKLLKKWSAIYDVILERDKKVCTLQINENSLDSSAELFTLSLGECPAREYLVEALSYYPHEVPKYLKGKISQLPPIFLGNTRGSVKHYNSYCNSEGLSYLSKIINGIKG
jgi:glycosyltransferase involved in cell wall biosynthesis